MQAHISIVALKNRSGICVFSTLNQGLKIFYSVHMEATKGIFTEKNSFRLNLDVSVVVTQRVKI